MLHRHAFVLIIFEKEEVHVEFLYGAKNSFEEEGQFTCISHLRVVVSEIIFLGVKNIFGSISIFEDGDSLFSFLILYH